MCTKVPVTIRAVIQRISRKLKKSNHRLKSNRRGAFWVVDGRSNVTPIGSIEEFARAHGCLELFEQIE